MMASPTSPMTTKDPFELPSPSTSQPLLYKPKLPSPQQQQNPILEHTYCSGGGVGGADDGLDGFDEERYGAHGKHDGVGVKTSLLQRTASEGANKVILVAVTLNSVRPSEFCRRFDLVVGIMMKNGRY